MKKPNPKLIALAGLFTSLFVLSQFYTNCSRAAVNMDESTSTTLYPGHPGADAITPAQYVTPLGHKKFISSIMRDNFSNTSSSSGWSTGLENYIQSWSENQGSQLGLACNPYESNTGQDCSGDVSNSNLPIEGPSTTIREALRLHLCDEVMGYDEAVTAALQNASVTASTPDADSIKALTGLFYRGDLPTQEFMDTIGEMDRHLASEGLGTKDRWRMILVEICESTEWQRL